MTDKLRDATPAELYDEPDAVLAALENGTIAATWMTRALAIVEIEQRRIRLEERAMQVEAAV